jgi:molecular chaperone DnaK
MSFVLGLDVGTASAAAATKRGGRVQPFALGDRTATLPAVVVLHDDGSSIVGDEAERLAGLELTRVARDLRNNPSLQSHPISVGGHIHTSHELLRTLYAFMVQKVTAAHRTSPTHVVLTHPALPEGVRCEAVDNLADEMFPGALVVPDPVAATVKLACDAVLPTDCMVAVYDLGGGTFDTTIVQRAGDRFSVVGDPGGLADFGGIDLDDLVLDHVNRATDGAVARLDLSDPAAMTALTRLRAECRDAKERLSYDTEVTIDASLPNNPALVQLTRAQLEAIVRPRLETTVDVLQETIDRAGLRTQDIDALALLGGTSRIPMVVDMLTQRTSMQVLVDPYPELTVALGAAQMVDDEAGAASVFPLADLALPSLEGLSQAGGTTPGTGFDLVGAGVGSVAPGEEPAMGTSGDPTLADQPASARSRGKGDDRDGGYGPHDGVADDLAARSGALVLVGLVAVLMIAGLLVALLGGPEGEGGTATDIASQINNGNDREDETIDRRRDTDGSSSPSSGSSSSDEDDDSSSDEETSSSTTRGSTSSGSPSTPGTPGVPTTPGGSTGGGGTTPTTGGTGPSSTQGTTSSSTSSSTSSTSSSTSSTTTSSTLPPDPPAQASGSWTATGRD